MEKVYIIVDACSGEDYSVDDPTILFVTTDYTKAKDFFTDEISNWEDGMENFDSDRWEQADGTEVYECTDYEGDSHRILKIVESEVE